MEEAGKRQLFTSVKHPLARLLRPLLHLPNTDTSSCHLSSIQVRQRCSSPINHLLDGRSFCIRNNQHCFPRRPALVTSVVNLLCGNRAAYVPCQDEVSNHAAPQVCVARELLRQRRRRQTGRRRAIRRQVDWSGAIAWRGSSMCQSENHAFSNIIPG